MKKLTVLLVVLGSFLGGCAAYVVDYPVASNRTYYSDRVVVPAYSYRYREIDSGGY